MRLGRRTAVTATYAALVAEHHLWLALDRPATVSLDGYDVPVQVEEQQGHHGVRLDLTVLPDTPTTYGVRVDGRPLPAPELRPPAAGARTRLEADGAGHLQVVRAVAVDERVLVDGLRLVGERVEIDLTVPAATKAARLVDEADRAVATLALGSVGTLTITPADLETAPPSTTLRVLVDTPTGPAPVRRRTNSLVDAGAGALLPAVHTAGAEHARARLRWSADATLLVRMAGAAAR